MADYFISLKRIFPQGDPLFVGPFDKKDDAIKTIANLITDTKIEYEVITSEKEVPDDIGRAILAEIHTKTAARRSGMKSVSLFGDKKDTLIGTKIPTTLKDVGIEGINGNQKKKVVEDNVDEDLDREYNGVAVKEKTEVLSEYEKSEAFIITKFPQNIEWLREHGVHGEVMVRARPDQIEGKSVVGTLPYRLGTLAKRVGVIDIPGIRADQIGTSLTTEDLYNADAKLRWFRVIEEKNEWQQLFSFLEKPGNWKKMLNFISEF